MANPTAVKQSLKRQRPARLLVWDWMREYGEFGQVVDSLADVLALMRTRNGYRQRFRIIYRPPRVDRPILERGFSTFCKLAFDCGGLQVVAEELKFVTRPNGGPPGWVDLTMTGRHQGIKLIGTSQRPAAVEKDFFSNATVVRSGRFNYKPDVVAMAEVLDVTAEEIPKRQPLQYIERDMQEGLLRRGAISAR